jgi:hypothetical protein
VNVNKRTGSEFEIVTRLQVNGGARNCSRTMAAGDSQRVWFDEMVETLRSRWRRKMPVEHMISLRDDLDRMLQQICSERRLRLPMIKCPKCGHVGEGTAPHVSVRAMILSVIRFDIDDPEPTRALEKDWKAYQKAHRLDIHGKPAAPKSDPLATACGHSHQL